jgi:hypothetical protein
MAASDQATIEYVQSNIKEVSYTYTIEPNASLVLWVMSMMLVP